MLPLLAMAESADDWWRGAEAELKRARTLKEAGDDDGAYYHAGQAIEFALKAIYLHRHNIASMPEACKGAIWHSLKFVAVQARLDADIAQLNRDQRANWMTARDWDSNNRFPGRKRPHKEINDLFVAVCNDRDGVWPWLEGIYRAT